MNRRTLGTKKTLTPIQLQNIITPVVEEAVQRQMEPLKDFHQSTSWMKQIQAVLDTYQPANQKGRDTLVAFSGDVTARYSFLVP